MAAPLAQCLALVEAVDEYPRWYPDVVRSVEVFERDADGVPSRVQTTLHVSVGPVTKDFELPMTVARTPPATVALAKIGGDAKFDVTWRLSEGQGTLLELELDASVDVPRLLPLGDVGNSVAKGFVSAASAELARRAAS